MTIQVATLVAVALTASCNRPKHNCQLTTHGEQQPHHRRIKQNPTAILDQVHQLAGSAKAAAAEAVVGRKVAEKMEAARQKYTVPEKYMTLMTSFFTSYMTEIYLADRDLDEYEKTLTLLMKKVLDTAKSPYQF